MKTVIRSAYSARTRKPLMFEDESLTKQSHKDQCDVNMIIAKYRKNGLLDHVSKYQGTYQECVKVDYQTALDTIIAADAAFESLPANIRNQFNNDPGEFLEFADDPNNIYEMREMGLLPKAVSADPAPADSAPADPSADPVTDPPAS